MAQNEWTLARFHEGEADLRWTKEQAVRVAQWSVILSGAIMATSRAVPIGRYAYVVVLVVQAISAVAWLVQLHLFAMQTRQLVHGLLVEVGQRKESESPGSNHPFLLGLFVLVVVAAAAVAIKATLGQGCPAP